MMKISKIDSNIETCILEGNFWDLKTIDLLKKLEIEVIQTSYNYED